MLTNDVSTRRPSSALALAGFVAACFLVAGLGGWATAAGLEAWYPSLVKPTWTPPNWLFGPVWTALYLAMAIAAWRAWRRVGWRGGWGGALAPFGVQLALNLLWSLGFFGLRNPGLGVVLIILLWAAIAVTWQRFRRIDALAGWLIVPYLAWVTFAGALNIAVWWLNR